MLGVPRRIPGRGNGAAATGVPAFVPSRVHRSLAGRALDVPALPVGHRLDDDGRRPASSGLGVVGFSSAWVRVYGFSLVETRVERNISLQQRLQFQYNLFRLVFQIMDAEQIRLLVYAKSNYRIYPTVLF